MVLIQELSEYVVRGYYSVTFGEETDVDSKAVDLDVLCFKFVLYTGLEGGRYVGSVKCSVVLRCVVLSCLVLGCVVSNEWPSNQSSLRRETHMPTWQQKS